VVEHAARGYRRGLVADGSRREAIATKPKRNGLIAQARDPVFVSRQRGHADSSMTLKVYAHCSTGP
jgi:integrase